MGPGQWVGLTTQLPRLNITMGKKINNPTKKLQADCLKLAGCSNFLLISHDVGMQGATRVIKAAGVSDDLGCLFK